MTEEILMEFCGDEEDLRFGKPFSDDEFSYATNGHIAIKINKVNDFKSTYFTNEKNNRLDRFLGAVNQANKKTNWIKVKKVKSKRINCYECNGAGLFECNCSYCTIDHDCETCKGSGKVHKIDGEIYLNSKFAKVYLELISKLPNAMISPSENDENGMAAFKFDGGCGCIVPMSK